MMFSSEGPVVEIVSPTPPVIPFGPVDLAARSGDLAPESDLVTEQLAMMSDEPERPQIGQPSASPAPFELDDTPQSDSVELQPVAEDTVESALEGHGHGQTGLPEIRIEDIGTRHVLEQWVGSGMLGFRVQTDRGTRYLGAVPTADAIGTFSDLRFSRHDASGSDLLALRFTGAAPVGDEMLRGMLSSQFGHVGALEDALVVFTPLGMQALMAAQQEASEQFSAHTPANLSMRLCLTPSGTIAVTEVSDRIEGTQLQHQRCR
jgi:hypothetical protein